jgi:hypothetical protein
MVSKSVKKKERMMYASRAKDSSFALDDDC